MWLLTFTKSTGLLDLDGEGSTVVCACVEVGAGLGEGDAIGTGATVLIATPLFQTNFLPIFTQVNFLPM
jgi:hypothetical protein